jgi:hypothetical protein
VAIFGYIGAWIVEAITHGVVTEAIIERRRRRAIDELRNHYIICVGTPAERLLLEELFAPNQAVAR